MSEAQLDAVFGALADPTRRAILARLTQGEASVADLAAPFPMSQPAVSRHLRVLEDAGLITRTRQATARLSQLWDGGPPRARAPGRLSLLRADPRRDSVSWLVPYRDYWNESYERLDELLASVAVQRKP